MQSPLSSACGFDPTTPTKHDTVQKLTEPKGRSLLFYDCVFELVILTDLDVVADSYLKRVMFFVQPLLFCLYFDTTTKNC